MTPTSAADVVGIFDQNFRQLFQTARPIKATIKEASKIFEHPVEDGSTIIDFTITLPVEIELSLMLTGAEYRDVYQNIRQSFKNRDVLSVQTKTATYANMIIESLPHDEDPEQFDAVALALRLREVQFVTAQYATLPAKVVRDKKNATTVNRGQQQPKTSTKSGSILSELFK